jgi:hypothetical protein
MTSLKSANKTATATAIRGSSVAKVVFVPR